MPNKYTDALGNQLVKAYTQLGAISLACDASGINKTTLYDWMHRGANGEEPYQSLYFRMRVARAKKAKALMVAAAKDKGGPQFLLERLFPAEFGQNNRSNQHAMEALLERIFPLISLEAQHEILEALMALDPSDEARRLALAREAVDAE